MQSWKKKHGIMRPSRFVTVFDITEREFLGTMAALVAEQLIERAQSVPHDDLAELTGMPSGHKEPPADPRLARLLPDFEREEDEEFEGDNALLRSFHEQDILKEKLENLQAIISALGPGGGREVEIGESEAHQWVQGLNDIRLFLASSDEYDPNVVEWLAYIQESLLEQMMP